MRRKTEMQDMVFGDSSESGSSGIGSVIGSVVKWGGALLSLFLVATIIVWGYRVGTRDARDVPVIKALLGPARVAPENPGGSETPHKGLELNEVLAGGEAGIPDGADLAPPPDLLSDEDVPPLVEETDIAAVDNTPEPVPQNSPTITPRPRPAGLAVPAARPASNAENDSGVPAGTRTVQLGAFDTESEAEVQWALMRANHEDLLGSREMYIQRTETNGRIFFGLRALGFENAGDQANICAALQARNAICLPVTVR